MLEAIIKGKIRRKLLEFFFSNPEREFYVRELERLLNEPFEPLRRELLNLHKAGILNCSTKAALRLFSINKNYFLYEELKNLILKSEKTKRLIKESLSTLWNIKFVFLYENQKNKEQFSLVIIGDVNKEALGYLISSLEKEIKQKIYFFNYTLPEFVKKLQKKDSFLMNIINASRVLLIGSEREFDKIIKNNVG